MMHFLYKGEIYHKRFIPREHEFSYPVFYLKLSLKNIKNNKIVSYNKFSLISFYDCDHGHRNGDSLFDFASSILKKHNIQTEIDDIIIHTFPRILGYVFNPVSFWYLKDREGNEIGIIAEVNNTFGETYSYFIKSENLDYHKTLHVSPFNQIEGYYKFHFQLQDNKEKITINYFVNNQLKLHASISALKHDLEKSKILGLLVSYPFMTLMNVYRIHYQALLLYFKKIPFFGKNGAINDK